MKCAKTVDLEEEVSILRDVLEELVEAADGMPTPAMVRAFPPSSQAGRVFAERDRTLRRAAKQARRALEES